MKSKEPENLEMLVENMMKDIPLETPSVDFTTKVMTEVTILNKKKAFSYQPVISKVGWLIIFGSIGIVIAWLAINGLLQDQSPSKSYFYNFNFEKVFNIFSGFQLSNPVLNIIGIAMIMIFIQMVLLKTHLNKKIKNSM